jgi:hypothetical protein
MKSTGFVLFAGIVTAAMVVSAPSTNAAECNPAAQRVFETCRDIRPGDNKWATYCAQEVAKQYAVWYCGLKD